MERARGKLGAGYLPLPMLVGVAVVLATALLVVPHYRNTQKASAVWDEAISAANNHEYDKAIGLYQEAERLAPEYVGAKFPSEIAKVYLGKARKLAEESHDLAAAESFATVVKYAPKLARKEDVYFSAAQSYRRARKFRRALTIAEVGVKAHAGKNKQLANLVAQLKKDLVRQKQEK